MSLSWTRLCIGLLIGLIAYGELEAASIHHRKHKNAGRKCGYDVSVIQFYFEFLLWNQEADEC